MAVEIPNKIEAAVDVVYKYLTNTAKTEVEPGGNLALVLLMKMD